MENFHTQLLVVSERLLQGDIGKIKLLCSDVIPEGTLEKLTKGYEVFVELEQRGLLNSEHKNYLISILNHIGRKDLANILVPVQQNLLPYQDLNSSKKNNRLHINMPELGPEINYFSPKCVNTPRSPGWFTEIDSGQHIRPSIPSAECGHIPADFRIPNFIDRKAEAQKIIEELTEGESRLVTITGPPGFGKSSLAYYVGHKLASSPYNINVYSIRLRHIASMYAIAYQIILSLGRSPSDDPISQTKQHLFKLEKETIVILDNAEFFLESPERDDFFSFVSSVGEKASRVRMVMTTSHAVRFYCFPMHEERLRALKPDESASLIRAFAPHLSEEEALELGEKVCQGVPLLLRTAASAVCQSLDCKTLIKEFYSSPAKVLRWLSDDASPQEQKMFQCLDVCFERLTFDMRAILVCLTLFPSQFTAEEANVIIPKYCLFELQCLLSKLLDSCMIQYCGISKRYYLHNVIQAYCSGRIGRNCELGQTYLQAKKLFCRHYLLSLQNISHQCMSVNSLQASKLFQKDHRNISQALVDAIQEPDLKNYCLDVASEARCFLIMALKRERFLSLYQSFATAAKDAGDMERYADALTSTGCCRSHHCHCRYPCPGVINDLQKAYDIYTSESITKTLNYAVCCGKLGKCIVQREYESGKPTTAVVDKALGMIDEATLLMEEKKNEVYLAVMLCDLADAYDNMGKHEDAISLRLEKALPKSRKFLGDHPFTASLLNAIGSSYISIQEHDAAVTYKTEALKMRETFLGRHQETAWSYYDIGKALEAQGKLEEALESFNKSLDIQKEVLGAHSDTLDSYKRIVSLLEKLGKKEEAAQEGKMLYECQKSLIQLIESQSPIDGVYAEPPRRCRSLKVRAYADYI